MKRICFFLLLTILAESSVLSQDFKYDNQFYQTISWNEFFSRLEKNPNLVFFDIRTPGERHDSSSYLSMNQGRIEGAIETDYFDFPSAYPEYLKHKQDTIYLYCSHSRRSRLLAKQLADSAFKKVISINGGMSYLNSFSKYQIPLKARYYKTKLDYELVPPDAFIQAINNDKFYLLDVRPDSVYKGISKEAWENLYGRIPGVMHIPFDKITGRLKNIPENKIILLFDNDGEIAPKAAKILKEKGYSVRVLLFGLDNLVSYLPQIERSFLKTRYPVILPVELLEIADNDNTVIIDVRTVAEYNNSDSIAWKNVGRIKKAVNIPLSELTKETVIGYKGKKIVLYDIMMHEELFAFAEKLESYGITDFYLLSGGITQLKWEIYNADKKGLEMMVEDK